MNKLQNVRMRSTIMFTAERASDGEKSRYAIYPRLLLQARPGYGIIVDAALGGHANYDTVSLKPTRKLADCCCEHVRDMASSLMLLLVAMATMRQEA